MPKPSVLSAFAAAAAILAMAASTSRAGTRVSLFNGKDLKGWHAQGDCQWAAVDGGIRGVNPRGNWCHLVTDSAYTDYAIGLDYKIVRGNTGLYVRARGENQGCCGLEGTQVDIGPSQDGSVMWVMGGEWKWYELITKAPAQGLVDYKAWNRLDVELQGKAIKTAVNGHAIWSTPNAEKMLPTGAIALQLHSGGAGDTILFRNLDLYLPRKIPGCLDSAYLQYNREANYAVKDSCITRKPTSLAGRLDLGGGFAMERIVSLSGTVEVSVPRGARRLELLDAAGKPAWSLETAPASPREVRAQVGRGVYHIRVSY